ncbi:hypothetical protein IB286_00695 [Spongiibacter sp. KMU-158]|uniref:Uncharacterized protein n=1 Tax=Spongiibacter pelagi TaxID=2760804 RepID=A0A927BXS2_9GAMM|nr:hypothetical protein [Spongiibacter pelagi]MBD2857504.1 hypothetical protein [Spongiibacter pelagi]
MNPHILTNGKARNLLTKLVGLLAVLALATQFVMASEFGRSGVYLSIDANICNVGDTSDADSAVDDLPDLYFQELAPTRLSLFQSDSYDVHVVWVEASHRPSTIRAPPFFLI